MGNGNPEGQKIILQTPHEAAMGVDPYIHGQQNTAAPKGPVLNPANVPIVNEEPQAPNSIGKATTGVGGVVNNIPKADYLKGRLAGMTDGDIFQMGLANKRIVTMRDREASWGDYGKEVYKDDRQAFDMAYDQSAKDYEQYKKQTIETYAPIVSDADLIDKRSPRTSLSDPTGRDPRFKNPNEGAIDSGGYYVDSQGFWTETKSAEQIADKKGSLVGDKYYEDFGEAIVAYNKEQFGDDNVLKTMAWQFGPGFFLSDKDDRHVPDRILEYNEQGEPYWKLVSPFERIKGSQIRSVWGPRTLYNSAVGDLFGPLVNSLVTNIPSIFGSFISNVGAGAGLGVGGPAINGGQKLPFGVGDFLSERGDYMQNLSSRLYFNESEMQQRGEEGTLTREVGGAVGMIIQAYLTGGAATELQALRGATVKGMTANVLTKEAVKKGATLSMTQVAQNAAIGSIQAQRAAAMNRIFFAATMADGFHQGSKEAGLSAEDSALTYGLSFVGSWALIGVGHKLFNLDAAGSPHGVGLANRFIFGDIEAMTVARAESQPIIKKNLEAIAKLSGKSVADLSEAQVKQAGKISVFETVKSVSKKALSKVSNPAKPIVSHMATASTEMTMMHIANNAIMMGYDYGMADDGAEDGNGKYGVKNVTEGWGHAFISGLAMGAFSGGMQKFQEYRDPQRKAQNRTSMDYLMAGKQNQLYKAHEKLKSQSWYGSDTIDAATGKTVEKGAIDPQTGQKYVTLNDVGYETAVRGIKAVEDVYVSSGIKEWHQSMKSDPKNPNAEYMKDPFDRQFSDVLKSVVTPDALAKDVMELLLKKRGIEAELSKEGITEAEKAKLEKEISTIDKDTSDFMESINRQKQTGTRSYSSTEGRIIRGGLVSSKYAYDVANKTFRHFTPIKSVGNLRHFEIQLTAAEIDAFNKAATLITDPSKLSEIRQSNNQEVVGLFGEVSTAAGVNSELLGKIEGLHAKQVSVGIAPGERAAADNLIAKMHENVENDYTAIVDEIASKYGVKINEAQREEAGDNEYIDNVYSEAIKSDPSAEKEYGAKIDTLKKFDQLAQRMDADKELAFSRGDKTVNDLLKDVYTSLINHSDPENPTTTSIKEILDNLKNSDLSNPSEISKIEHIIADLAAKAEILDVNKNTYSKLKDEVSLLNKNISPSDKDVDGKIEGSIRNEIERLMNEAIELANKAVDISAEARKRLDLSFIASDSSVRLHIIDHSNDIIAKLDLNESEKIANLSIANDLAEAQDITTKVKEISDRRKAIVEKSTTEALTEAEREEGIKLTNEIEDLIHKRFSYVLSAEHKMHQLFNSSNGEKLFKQLSSIIEDQSFETKKNNMSVGGSSSVKSSMDGNRAVYYSGELYNESLSGKDIAYAYNYFVPQLNNIKRLSSKTFYEAYSEYTDAKKSAESSYVAPTFEQMRVIQHAVSFLVDPALSGTKVETKISSVENKFFKDGMLAILGFAGTGKTKVTMPFIMDIYSKIKESTSSSNTTNKNIPSVADAKKDIEKRKNQLKNVESKINPHAKHPKFNVGDKYNDGNKYEVKEVKDLRTDKSKEGIQVVTKIISPAEVDSSGVQTKAAVIETSIFDSKQHADSEIELRYRSAKQKGEDNLQNAYALLALAEQSPSSSEGPIFILTAPDLNQRENMKSAISNSNSKSASIHDLEIVLEGKLDALSKGNDVVIIIDEASQLTQSQILKLRELREKTGAKIIGLADEGQITGNPDDASTKFLYDIERTTPITDIHRTGVYDISRLQQTLRQPLSDNNTLSTYVVYNNTQYVEAETGAVKGVRLRGNEITSREDQLNQFAEDMKRPDLSRRTAFIASNDAERSAVVSQLIAKGVEKSLAESSVFALYTKDFQAKGLQWDRVYVNLNKNIFGNEYYKAMLTGVSRGISYVDVITDVPKSSISSDKVETLSTDNQEYIDSSRAAYKEYADDQPRVIKSLLDNITDVNLDGKKAAPMPASATPGSSGPGTGPNPSSGPSTASSGTAKASTKTQTKGGTTFEGHTGVYHPVSDGAIVDKNKTEVKFGSPVVLDGEDTTSYVTGFWKKGRTNYISLINDNGEVILVKSKDFIKVYSKFDPKVGNSISTIVDPNRPIKDVLSYSTVVEQMQTDTATGNVRVSTIFKEGRSPEGIKQTEHVIKAINRMSGVGERTISGRLKKVFIAEGEDGRTNSIYNAIDTTGMTPIEMKSVFGTDTPDLVDGKYFLFSNEYSVSRFGHSISALESLNSSIRDAAMRSTDAEWRDIYDSLVKNSASSKIDRPSDGSPKIQFERFADRVRAYKKAMAEGRTAKGNVTELSGVYIPKITQGNVVFGTEHKTFAELAKIGTKDAQMVNGYFAVQMGEKTVWMSKPHLIYDLASEASAPLRNSYATAVMYTKVSTVANSNGATITQKVFEPGYYTFITFDPEFGENRIMVKMKTKELSYDEIEKVFKPSSNKNQTSWSDPDYYDEMNRLINANKYFIEKNNLHSILGKPVMRPSQNGPIEEYRVDVRDITSPNVVNENATRKKITDFMDKVKDILSKSGVDDVKFRNFPPGNPSKGFGGELSFDNSQTLSINLEDVHWPQIVTNEKDLPVISSNAGPSSGPINRNTPKPFDFNLDSSFNSDSSSRESTPSNGKTIEDVTKKKLTRDAAAKRSYLLAGIFGESESKSIVANVARQIFEKSLYSNIFYADYGNLEKLKAVDAIFNEIKAKAKAWGSVQINDINGNPIEKPIEELTLDDVKRNGESIRSAYNIGQLAKETSSGSRPVFDIIAKLIFDKSVLGTNVKEVEVSESQSSEGAENLTSGNSRTKYGEQDSPMKSFSDSVRFTLGSQELFDFSGEYAAETGENLSPLGVLQAILPYSSKAKMNSRRGSYSFSLLADAIRADIESMKPMNGVSDKSYNTLASIYYTFFAKNGEGFNKTGRYSYSELIDKEYMEMQFANNPSITPEYINAKSNAADAVLSNIFNAVYSKDSRNYSNTLYDSKNGKFVNVKRRLNTVSEISGKLKTLAQSKIYELDISSGKSVLRRSMSDKLHPVYYVKYTEKATGKISDTMYLSASDVESLIEQKGDSVTFHNDNTNVIESPLKQKAIDLEGFRVDENGLYSVNSKGKKTQVISSFTKENGSKGYKFNSIDKEDIMFQAVEILKLVGMRGEISTATLNAYLNDSGVSKYEKLSGERLELDVNKESFAEILHSAIDVIVHPEKYKTLDEYKINLEADENATFSQNEYGSEDGVETPILRFNYRNDLAIVESVERGGVNNRSHKGAEGQSIFSIQNGNGLMNSFPSSMAEGDSLIGNKSLEFNDELRQSVELFNSSPYILGSSITSHEIISLNPFYDHSAPDFELKSITLNSGIKGRFTGKGVNRMSPHEILSVRIGPNFIDSILRVSSDGSKVSLKSEGAFEYSIPLTIADAGNTYYALYADNNGMSRPLIITPHDSNKGIKGSAKVNWDYDSYGLLKAFQLKRNQQAQSQNGLIGALEIFSRLSDSYNQDPNVSNRVNLILNSIKNDPSFRNSVLNPPRQAVNPAESTKGYELFQEMMDLMSSYPDGQRELLHTLESIEGIAPNIHYTVDKTGRVKIGNGIKLEFKEMGLDNEFISGDSLFTANNYKKIEELLQGHNISDLIINGRFNKRLPEDVSRSLKLLFKEMLTGKMMRFRSYLFSEKVSISDSTKAFFSDENGNKQLYKSQFYSEQEWGSLPDEVKSEIADSSYLSVSKNGVNAVEMNPFYEAYYLADLLHSVWMTESTMGNPMQYNSIVNIAYRAHSMLTPGSNYTIKERGMSVHPESYVGFFNEKDFNVKNELVKLFGGTSKDTAEGIDGMEVQVGVEAVLRRASLGPDQIKSDARHQKEIQNDLDIVTGMKLLIKSSTLDLRALRKGSSFWRNTEKKMLSAKKFISPDAGKEGTVTTLYDKLVELDFNDEALAEWMFNKNGEAKKVQTVDGEVIDIRHTYISRLTPPSAAKLTGGHKMFDINMEEFNTSHASKIDYRTRLMVLDVNKDALDQKSSNPAQQMNTYNIGENNFVRVTTIKNAARDISYSVNAELKDFGPAQLKGMMAENVASIRNAGKKVQLIMNPKMSINIPFLAKDVRSIFSKQHNKGITPEHETGGTFVQYPGDALDMFSVKVDIPKIGLKAGDRITLSEFEKYQKLVGPEAFEAAGGLAKAEAFVVRDGKKLNIESVEYLKNIWNEEQMNTFLNGRINKKTGFLEGKGEIPVLDSKQSKIIINDIISSGGEVTPYEIMVPFTNYRNHGFSGDVNDPFYYKNFQYGEILSVVLSSGETVRFDRLGNSPEARKAAFEGLFGAEGDGLVNMDMETIAMKVLDKDGSIKSKERKENGEVFTEYSPADVKDGLIEYFENFIDAHDYMLNRVPASTPGSGFRGRVVEFIHDGSNSAFVSAKKNIIDNSDFDIDELHVYTKNIKAGNDPIKIAQNKQVQASLDYMVDPNNLSNIMTPVSTDSLKDVIDSLPSNKRGSAKKFLYDLVSNVMTEDMFNQGVETPGIFANGIKAYTNLYYAFSKVKGDQFVPIELFGKKYSRFFDRKDGLDTGEFIVNNLASYLQASVDNKDGLLGQLAANPSTAPMIITMAALNFSPSQIREFLFDPKVKNIMRDIIEGRNIDFYNKTKNNQFNSWRSTLEISRKNISDALASGTIVENGQYVMKNTDDVVSMIKSLSKIIEVPERVILSREKEFNDSFIVPDELDLFSSAKEGREDAYDFNKAIEFIDDYIDKINSIEKISMLSDRLSDVAKVLSINQGLKPDDYKAYDYGKTLDKLKNPSKYYQFLEKRPGKATIFGKDVDGVETLSEYEVAIKANKVMDDFIKIENLIPKLPDVQAFIIQYENAERSLSTLLTNHTVFKNIDEKFLTSIRTPRLFNDKSFYALRSIRSKVIATMFLEKNGHKLTDTSNKYDTRTKQIVGNLDLRTPKDQLEFVTSFHELIKSIQNNPELYEKVPNGLTGNKFLELVEVKMKINGDEYLSLKNLSQEQDASLSLDENASLEKAIFQFERITGIDIEQKMFLYNLIQHGLDAKPGSMIEYVNPDKFMDYSKFIDNLNMQLSDPKSGAAKEISDRYKDRVAVTMREHLKKSNNGDFRDDYELNVSENKNGAKYLGGIIPVTLESGHGTRSIKDFPEYIRYEAPISGMSDNALKHDGVYKLMHDVVLNEKTQETGSRYVRIEKKISDMLGSYIVDGVAYEVYGRSDIGKTIHSVSMNNISKLNRGESIIIRSSQVDTFNYKTGKYYIKTGQVVEVKVFGSMPKQGLSIKLNNPNITLSLDAPVFKEPEGVRSNVDFSERNAIEEAARTGGEGIKQAFEESTKNQFLQLEDKTDALKLVRDRIMNYEQAIIADAILNSAISRNLKTRGKFEVISFATRPDIIERIKASLPSYAKVSMARAVRDPDTGDIIIDSDHVNSNEDIAYSLLHEVSHDISADVIDKYLKKEHLDPESQAFASYMDRLYNHVKTVLEANGYKPGANKKLESADMYGITNLKEFVAEAISSVKMKNAMSTVPAMNPEVAKMGVTNAWKEFLHILKTLFSKGIKGFVNNNTLEEFLAVSSRYFEGESITMLGKKGTSRINAGPESMSYSLNMPESQIRKLELSLSAEHDAMTSEELRKVYYGVGKSVEKISDNNDFSKALVPAYNINDPFSNGNVEYQVNRVISIMSSNKEMSISGKYKMKENGKEYEVKSITDLAEVTEVAKQIITDKAKFEPIVKEKIIQHISKNPMSDLGEVLEKSQDLLDRVFNLTESHNVNLLKDSEYKNSFFDSKTFDPIVTSYKTENGTTHVSLVDVTTNSLSRQLTSVSERKYLADFISNFDPNSIDLEQFRLIQTEAGLRKFNLLMLSLMIKNKNPNVVFDNISVMNPIGESKDNLSVFPQDYLVEMKSILSSKVVYDILPAELKELVDNPKTWEKSNVNMVTSLRSFYAMEKELYHSSGSQKAMTKSKVYEDLLYDLNQKAKGFDIYKGDVERIIRNRMKEVEKLHGTNENAIIQDREYLALSKALEFIKRKGQLSKNKMEDIGKLSGWYDINYNIANPIAQFYINDFRIGIETAKNKFVVHQNKMRELVKNLNNNVMESMGNVMSKSPVTLFDVGYKRFDRMFIKTKALNKATNELIDVNSFDIHYELDGFIPQKSKEALSKGEVSKEELALGGYIVKAVKDSIITKLINNRGFSVEEANDWYSTNWKDGRLPVMQRRASEKIFTKDWAKGLKEYATKFSRSNEIFDYINESDNNNPTHVSDMFISQAGNGELGSMKRESFLGITSSKENGGRVELIGNTKEEIERNLIKNQSEIEQNLEVVMAYYMMNHFNKEALDPTMSTYYASMALLSDYESKYSDKPGMGGRFKNLKDYLESQKDLIVLGKRKNLSGKDSLGIQGVNGKSKITADDVLSTVSHNAAAYTLGFNVLADVKNLLVNTLQIQSFAVANSIIGARKFYGLGDVNKSVALYTSNPKLAMALSSQYKTAGMDRSDLSNKQRHFESKNQLVSDHWLYINQFGGDYLIRTLSLMAHMNKKGVLDAYSLDKDGKLVYDETKDARLYTDGKITENGKLIKMELLKNMKAEGTFFGEVSLESKLPRAFDEQLRNASKAITDKFIMGGAYDDATRMNLDAISIGRAFAMFKKYLSDKARNLYMEGQYSSTIGDYEVKDIELDGEIKKDVVFEGDYMEGLVQSVMGIYREARAIEKDGKYNNLVEMWQGQDDIRKMNLARLGHDAAFALIFLSIMPALMGDDDEDNNNFWRAMMSSPLGKTMNHSVLDLMSTYRPGEYFGALSEPFYALNWLGRASSLIAATCKMDVNEMDRYAAQTFGTYKTVKTLKNAISGDSSSKK